MTKYLKENILTYKKKTCLSNSNIQLCIEDINHSKVGQKAILVSKQNSLVVEVVILRRLTCTNVSYSQLWTIPENTCTSFL